MMAGRHTGVEPVQRKRRSVARVLAGIAELLAGLCLLILVQFYLLLFPLLAGQLIDLQFQAAAEVPERVQALEVRGEVQEAALWQETERWAGEGTWESGN